MSVASESYGYASKCCKSHEFLRRACTVTPSSSKWVGDLLITTDKMVKQSEVNDIRGGDCDTEIVFSKQHSSCSDIKSELPSQFKVESTDIRTGGANTFEYLIPKAEDQEDEVNWELDIYQSTNDCGTLMDGGDAYQNLEVIDSVTSLCGTIERHLYNPSAHYLDNRKSYSEDPDNGLLVAIRNGINGAWEVRYSPVERILTEGLVMSDDVTAAFTTALSALGMTHEDVFEFGMI